MKHLNPRQGITNAVAVENDKGDEIIDSVKHLNPRQGITNRDARAIELRQRYGLVCETPKSPPGDYKAQQRDAAIT